MNRSGLFLYMCLIISCLNGYGQNSPLNVNSTSGQGTTTLTSSAALGSLLKLERYSNTGGFFSFEAGAGSNDDFRLYLNSSWSTPLMSFKTDGNVGVGTASPSNKLTVLGTFGLFGTGLDGSTYQRFVLLSDVTNGLLFEAPKNSSGTNLPIQLNWRGGGTPPLYINGSGNVGIGTSSGLTSKLTVAGDVHSREVKVTISAGSDFVFRPDYDLRALNEVKQFIKENGHLPDVEPAKDMETNGIELGKMDMKLLQKIEELTLYLIDVNEEMARMKEENQKLRDKISKLEKN